MANTTKQQGGGLPGWLLRLKDELQETRERRNSLVSFINRGEIGACDRHQMSLLKLQRDAMNDYVRIMEARLANAMEVYDDGQEG